MTEIEEGRPSGKESRPSNHYGIETQRHSQDSTAREVAAPFEAPRFGSADAAHATGIHWEQLPLVLDSQTVAHLYGCSLNTLYELCRRGELPAKRVGRQWRFGRESLRRYIEGIEGDAA